MISRRSHQAENTPAYAGAPTERLKYAPSIPHWSPRMNARLQITSVDPRIRMPACRNASPKNLNTRPPNTSAKTRAANLAMSPKEATQSLGTASHDLPISSSRSQMADGRWQGFVLLRSAICDLRSLSSVKSLDDRNLGMRGKRRLCEDVVEREDAEEGDHHALVHGPAHTLG